NRQTGEHGQFQPLALGATQQDLDQLIVFAVLADAAASKGAVQESGKLGRTHPEYTGAVLVDVQPDHLARFLPIQVHVIHVRVFANLGGDLAREPANHVDVLAGDPELDRVAHRRTI